MIYFATPYAFDGNLGGAYNHYMELLPDDNDWMVFIDGDACFLTPKWGHQIKKIIDKYPDTGLFTCYTNRVGNKRQLLGGFISPERDILKIYHTAVKLQKTKYYEATELLPPISGHFMGVRKDVWRKAGKFKDGLLTIDNNFSRRVQNAGYKIRRMDGVYIFHLYRLWSNTPRKATGHLK